MIEALSRSSAGAYLNAIMALPRNMREMYMHAYQSFLWNKAVSKRLQLSKSDALEGDYVNSSKIELNEGDEEEAQDETTMKTRKHQSIQMTLYHSISPFRSFNFSLYNSDDYLENRMKTKKEGAIGEVVMPIYGSDVEISKESLAGTIYKELLDEEGISLEDFEFATKNFCVYGSWRSILGFPQGVQGAALFHEGPDEELLKPSGELMDHVKNHQRENLEKGKKFFVSFGIEFQLLKCSYATVFLREILHSSTSQSNLIKGSNIEARNQSQNNEN